MILMNRVICCFWALAITTIATADELPSGVNPNDSLLQWGGLGKRNGSWFEFRDRKPRSR